MLLRTFIKDGIKALKALYPEPEARSMMLLLCQERLGVMSYTHIIEPGHLIPPEEEEGLLEDVSRMAAGEPIQYVLGYTEFHGRIFKTDPRALIPRIETEMLVDEVLAHLPAREDGPLRILDLCTGSGCVAWSLAFEVPGAVVTGSDISEDALSLARSQFRRLPKAVVRPAFIKEDILDPGSPFPQCDVLTANPPYITLPEKEFMRPNVLDWEPGIALFAPEKDPLAFHRALALWARRLLVPGGLGVVEINEDLGPETLGVFLEAGFANAVLVEDFARKQRFVRFTKPI